MIEIAFPKERKDTAARVFPREYEEDELIVFHGTNYQNFELIKIDGFQPMGEPKSTSFVASSATALGYACNKRTGEDQGVVIAVKLLEDHNLAKSGNCYDLWDFANPPTPIAYCLIPQDYKHI